MLLSKIYPVTCHTDHVGHGTTFIAIKGFAQDGSKYIDKAISLGAIEIILEDFALLNGFEQKYPHIKFSVSQDIRKELAVLSSKRLDNPSSKLKIIGITGTKGKTTTAFLTEHILKEANYKTAILSTVKNKILNNEEPSALTTLSSDYLHMFFAECVNQGVTHVVMEVSSHALSLDRVYGIEFEIVCFTNLASEHMDFYSSLEDYFEAKLKLFNYLKNNGIAVINIDDEWGRLASKHASRVEDFSQKKASNIFTIQTINGLEITLNNSIFICKKLIGEFNAYNLVASVLMIRTIGIKDDVIQKALNTFLSVPGRLQLHNLKNGARAFVDYAHNPSSFEAVLKTLRLLTSHLIVVFGCGGDRDKIKRPIMGFIATNYGDEVIITDDNPRFEDHNQIIQDILVGVVKGKSVEVCLDRKEAISRAVFKSRIGSIIAILGKGHEDYYFVSGVKHYLSDFQEILKY